MAIATMRVPTIFTAVDRFSDVVSRMSGGVNKFSKTASSAVSRVDNKINGMWSSMNSISQLAIGGGVGGLFYYAGQDIMEYEKKLASLAAVTGTVFGSMNSQIETLGKETGRSVIDIAGSFEIVGSKMSQYLNNPEALKSITKASVLMADASRMELEPAIESLTGVMNIFGKSAGDANYIVNKLSAGEIVGSIKISETADILRQFGGTARLANVQVDESIALIQTLTKSLGVEGVGRGIRNLMSDLNMVGAFDKNKMKALAKTGVDMDILGNKSLDLVTRLKELKKLEGNSAAMGLFFKKTGIQTGATLFQNFDDYIRFLEAIKNTNAAQEQADKNNATLSRGIKYLKESFTNFIVTNNESNAVLTITKNLLSWMTDNMGSLINLVGLLIGAFLIWKAIVVLTAARLFILNVAMGISAFQAGAMAISMQGNAVAIGVYNIATLIATGSTAALGVSMFTVLAPILLILGAIGLLTYAFWDNADATDSMVSSQINSLGKGNSAMINSTKVMSSELQKQQQLMQTHKNNISIADKNSNLGSAIQLAKDKLKAAEIQNAKLPKTLRLSKDALAYQVRTGFYDFEDSKYKTKKEPYNNWRNPELRNKNPENLAGKGMKTLDDFINPKTGKLELFITTDNGAEAKLMNEPPKGIKVTTTSTKKPSTDWWDIF
jgi:TP901 family phage tail tape measure protein